MLREKWCDLPGLGEFRHLISQTFSPSLYLSRGKVKEEHWTPNTIYYHYYVPNLRNRSDTQYCQAANLPGSEGILGSSHEWFEANMIIRNNKYEMGTKTRNSLSKQRNLSFISDWDWGLDFSWYQFCLMTLFNSRLLLNTISSPGTTSSIPLQGWYTSTSPTSPLLVSWNTVSCLGLVDVCSRDDDLASDTFSPESP